MPIRTLILITLVLLTRNTAVADSTPQQELSGRWDSLRFTLGVLKSDYYVEQSVLVLYKTADGGILIVCGADKSSSRALDEAQTKAIISRITVFFSGAGPLPPFNTESKLLTFHMWLGIDKGMSHTTFFKSLDPKRDSEVTVAYDRFISDLSATK